MNVSSAPFKGVEKLGFFLFCNATAFAFSGIYSCLRVRFPFENKGKFHQIPSCKQTDHRDRTKQPHLAKIILHSSNTP
ncbi:hypothetical protein LF95_12010 [Thalassospira sp. TSL5-1]|nr:hypothetical protein LF95_12010 [Thalassospira sp. TSL5-1]